MVALLIPSEVGLQSYPLNKAIQVQTKPKTVNELVEEGCRDNGKNDSSNVNSK